MNKRNKEPDYKQLANYFQKIAGAFAPQSTPCPHCQWEWAEKLNIGISFSDAFVLIYRCINCNEIFTMSIEYPEPDTVMIMVCDSQRLNWLIDVFQDEIEMARYVPQLARQRRRERNKERGFGNE
jgi:hypothetical protein